MTKVVFVKAEHIEAGKRKYQAQQDTALQKLLETHHVKNKEVYRFADGRILVVDLLLNFGLLYASSEVFLDTFVFE